MKRIAAALKREIIIFSGILIAVLLISAEAGTAADWHEVAWVNDGDTITLKDGRRIRYIGINAPEIDHQKKKAEPFGYQAAGLNKQLTADKMVRLEFDRQSSDRYGRLLAYVFLADGSFINARMLAAGCAYFYYHSDNTKYETQLLNAQREAMQAGRGLWQDWQEEQTYYVGSKVSKRFHLPGCPYGKKIKKGNRVVFKTRWEAFWSGYAPAKRCLPPQF
jgi:endonuclease YncB( thermonuclease family)